MTWQSNVGIVASIDVSGKSVTGGELQLLRDWIVERIQIEEQVACEFADVDRQSATVYYQKSATLQQVLTRLDKAANGILSLDYGE